MDVLAGHIKDVHIKDGTYPTEGRTLDKECPVGEGKVDFWALLSNLKRVGYAGTLSIEREISGDQQISDIMKLIEYLKPMIAAL